MNQNDIEIDESSIDLKKVLSLTIKNWYWFTVSIAIFVIVAFLWNFFSTPIYQVETKILINEEGSTFMDPQMLVGQAFSPNAYKVRKEMQVLGSFSLTAEVLPKLPLEANWWSKDGFRRKLVYPPPFRIEYDSSHFQSSKTPMTITAINSMQIVVSYNELESGKSSIDTVSLGVYFESPLFRFKITPNAKILVGIPYQVTINNRDDLIYYFNGLELIEEKYSSAITVRFNDVSAQRAADYLDALSQSFLNHGVKRKNMIALNTIHFIESQLESVTDSLRYSEDKLEAFRRIRGATNLDFQTQKTLELLDGLEKDKARSIVFLNYYEYLKGSITQNLELNKLVVPSSMGISDEVLNKLVLDLMQFYSEKTEITVNE